MGYFEVGACRSELAAQEKAAERNAAALIAEEEREAKQRALTKV